MILHTDSIHEKIIKWYMHQTKIHRVYCTGMEDFGILWIWGFYGDFHRFFWWVWTLKFNPHGSPVCYTEALSSRILSGHRVQQCGLNNCTTYNLYTCSAVCFGLVFTRPLFELHFAEEHDGTGRLVQTHLFVVSKPERNKRLLHIVVVWRMHLTFHSQTEVINTSK